MSEAHTTSSKTNLIRDIVERKRVLSFKGGRLGLTDYQPFEHIGKKMGMKSEAAEPKDTSIKVADHDEPERVGVKVKSTKPRPAPTNHRVVAKPDVARPSRKPLSAISIVPPLSTAQMQRVDAVSEDEAGELHAPLAAMKTKSIDGIRSFKSYINGVAAAVGTWLASKHILKQNTNTVNSGLYGYSLNLSPAKVKITAAAVTGVMAIGLFAALLGNVPGIPDLMGGGKGSSGSMQNINATNTSKSDSNKSSSSNKSKSNSSTSSSASKSAPATTGTSASTSGAGSTFINDPVAPVTGGRGGGNIVQDTQQQTGTTQEDITNLSPTPYLPATVTVPGTNTQVDNKPVLNTTPTTITIN